MIIVIDNYDSFTYNLVQYFQQMETEVMVRKNDAVTVEEIAHLDPDLIVLSPGPGKPSESGVCLDVLRAFEADIPILGICLGHQLIVEAYGGTVRKGRKPMHGKVTAMTHDGAHVYEGLPESVQVTRYHSLEADKYQMPEQLQVTAVSEDGSIMGVRHRDYPVEGIQFHPESILTECGFTMLWNTYQQALRYQSGRKGAVV
ncbi:aminodeoxychorismate/anthranilate synthase component II [Halobacillus litoralis]|uniref:Aminodeoxychorismate/anthranilate synthase component II n=1 Tax=Halobacillus litoralis TaxID=45668 RepID=A0A845DV92_9BACI|nr:MULTISPECIES: aminodeoxychorismate/anthranilate synthase component II [Halobacillus]MYL20415.1 aminodeoxychorismate/anthranilate synthase component II [Halobacillus litoralis]MYL29509.1 aminodeoxychorismate/anthranilate synthase component II [Halobacillus halophilus]